MTQDQAQSLRSTLVAMMDNIAKKEPILDQLEQIGELQAQIASTAPAQLTHFLERRSYAKAIEFLDHGFITDDPNRPACDEEEAHP